MAAMLQDTAAGRTVTYSERDTDVHVGQNVQVRLRKFRSAVLMRIIMYSKVPESFNYVVFNYFQAQKKERK